MDPVHLHLLLNHLPIVGVPLVAALLGWGLVRGSREVVRAALGGAVLLAALSYPVFLTGEPAEEGVEHMAGFSERLVHEHEERAELALVAVLLTGAVAGAGLLLSRRSTEAPRTMGGVTLAALAVSGVLLGLTGLTGGQIRHEEIRGGAVAAGVGSEAGEDGEREQGGDDHD